MAKVVQLIHGSSPNGEVLYALDVDGNIYRSEDNPSTKVHGDIDWVAVTTPDSK